MAAALPFPKSDATLAEVRWKAAVGEAKRQTKSTTSAGDEAFDRIAARAQLERASQSAGDKHKVIPEVKVSAPRTAVHEVALPFEAKAGPSVLDASAGIHKAKADFGVPDASAWIHKAKADSGVSEVVSATCPIPETKAKGILDISGVFRGRELTRKERRLACGIAPIDELIGGGIVRGRISEIIGKTGAGRTSLAAAFAASMTGRGEVAAWIDAAGSFDPESMAAAGIDLARLLWVALPVRHSANETGLSCAAPYGSRTTDPPPHVSIRGSAARAYATSDFSHHQSQERAPCPASDFSQDPSQETAPYSAGGRSPELISSEERYFAEGASVRGCRARRAAGATVLKAAEWILAAGGFGLLVIDCGGLRDGRGRVGTFTQSAALRLARGAERSGTAVVVIGAYQMCGTFAALSLMLSRRRAGFSRSGAGAPALFDGLTVEARVMRNKLGGSGDAAIWKALAEPSGAAAPACTATSDATLTPRDSHASRERTNHAARRVAAL